MKNAEEIKWTGPRTDLTAKVGGYTLRVEQMDKGVWWWRVYCPDNTEIDGYGSSWKVAMLRCETEWLRALQSRTSHLESRVKELEETLSVLSTASPASKNEMEILNNKYNGR